MLRQDIDATRFTRSRADDFELRERTFDALSALVDSLLQIREDSGADSNGSGEGLYRIQGIRSAAWQLSEAVSRDAALLSSLMTGSVLLDRDTYTRSQLASADAARAWQRINVLSQNELVLDVLGSDIKHLYEQYNTDFKSLQERIVTRITGSPSALEMARWETISDTLIATVVRVDRRLADHALAQVKTVLASAERRLILDTILVLMCLCMALATHRVLNNIRHQATHDQLTGLPNRLHFEEELEANIEKASQGGDAVTLMFIDLDGFKAINDTVGHHMGDALLREVAKRIRRVDAEVLSSARMGGDEFAIIVTSEHCDAVAQQLLESLCEPVVVDGVQMTVGASIGTAQCPQDAVAAADLLVHADSAMYEAKAVNGNCVRCFEPAMEDRFKQRLCFESELRTGMSSDQFMLHYQPQIDVHTRYIIAVEALVRWDHPCRGLVLPDAFIPGAPDNGLIHEIGHWVLDQACQQAALWQTETNRNLVVSVNGSAQQVASENFAQRVIDATTRHRLAPCLLELEVSETVLKHLPELVTTLRELRAAGICIALNDLGTSAASLSDIDRDSVDRVKFDRTLLQEFAPEDSFDTVFARMLLLA